MRDVFAALRGELELHMQKEEQILFPMIKQFDSGDTGAAGHCGTIENPIRMMEDEHDSAGDALAITFQDGEVAVTVAGAAAGPSGRPRPRAAKAKPGNGPQGSLF